MPLMIEGARVPPRWDEHRTRRPGVDQSLGSGTDCLRIALVNNMPDPALEDTEMQFLSLIEAAAADTPVSISFYSLQGVPRGPWGQRHLAEYYSGTSDLFERRYDGVIVTGTEPKHVDLRSEPYWPSLSTLFDWAETNTVSTILSCLAAHASVLHSDGIERYPLGEKQCGVFTFKTEATHPLVAESGGQIRVPHSRWNEVKPHELAACGYTMLTQSSDGGADAFSKKKKRSLFVHFQGHPEYEGHTLLKEYRRDIKRFARGERDTYPSLPTGYFDLAAAKLASDFREAVLNDRREVLMDRFPEPGIASTLRRTWHSSAVATYRSWIRYLVSNKATLSDFSPLSIVPRGDRLQSACALVTGNELNRRFGESGPSMLQSEPSL